MVASNQHSRTWRRSILFPPCTIHFVTTHSTVRIALSFEQELVVRLLETVDRCSAKGKRDYAILLLACWLGMRVGDIRTLKLEQIHWEDSTIEVTQSKTGLPLSLPLTSEVGEALIDYLKS